MLSTTPGTTVDTTADAAVTLLAASNTSPKREVIVYNTSANLGFVSVDGGSTWAPLPASGSLTLDLRHCPTSSAVLLKRVPSGSDVTAYAFSY